MHSLETGIIIAIAMFFFFNFLQFTFEKEMNISKEIINKKSIESMNYTMSGEKDYQPELLKNILDIINEKGSKYNKE